MRIADPRDVLISPVVSEKSYGLLDENKYTFIVAPDANKTQIKLAVEQVFGVKVTGVNTNNREGKRVRTRYGWGRRAATKRAIVTVAVGEREHYLDCGEPVRLSARRYLGRLLAVDWFAEAVAEVEGDELPRVTYHDRERKDRHEQLVRRVHGEQVEGEEVERVPRQPPDSDRELPRPVEWEAVE